jgi:hypothetical protein
MKVGWRDIDYSHLSADSGAIRPPHPGLAWHLVFAGASITTDCMHDTEDLLEDGYRQGQSQSSPSFRALPIMFDAQD